MTELSIAKTPSTPAHGVSFGEAFRVWVRVALLSFGGPAAQIAVMHRSRVMAAPSPGECRFRYGSGEAGKSCSRRMAWGMSRAPYAASTSTVR